VVELAPGLEAWIDDASQLAGPGDRLPAGTRDGKAGDRPRSVSGRRPVPG